MSRDYYLLLILQNHLKEFSGNSNVEFHSVFPEHGPAVTSASQKRQGSEDRAASSWKWRHLFPRPMGLVWERWGQEGKKGERGVGKQTPYKFPASKVPTLTRLQTCCWNRIQAMVWFFPGSETIRAIRWGVPGGVRSQERIRAIMILIPWAICGGLSVGRRWWQMKWFSAVGEHRDHNAQSHSELVW